ncbi:hypothetical protein GCM10015535_43790 [Streptomyces gelaticus]|uniref:Uncharacterized protein n=1 Tax=Streptomyces gelaticus TaxID=285446 RepID=A0ABQ2W416_9ACTN|nr:hypothetical protein GCM10015535_43790 [Streptomyces gelaticus]
MIHWIELNEAPVSSRMLGMAILTIVTSTRSMKAAVITMASAIQRRRSDGSEDSAGADAVDGRDEEEVMGRS